MNNTSYVPLPTRKDSLVNNLGYPRSLLLPQLDEIEKKYTNTLYRPDEITSDWVSYKKHLKKIKPEFCPKITLVGHDESEIENITLMSLGGVALHMNGVANYALLGKRNIHLLDSIIEENKSEWIGFNVYTGFEDYIFEWIKQYKIHAAQRIFKDKVIDFSEADRKLKLLVEKHKGPVYKDGTLIYAPIIIGGHYNNYSYTTSYQFGADYVVRGKGINLLRDILLQLYAPGIYHDPMPYANIPLMDREGFYRDTYNFSDYTKKYAKSPIKSVLTALGCNYTCTYCYIGSLIDNLNDAYKDSNIRPPSIIQDRPIETVLKEGEEILRLDKIYGAETTTVFDQADISLNNIEWWKSLSKHWMEKVKIKFYIQARPAMLAGDAGANRITIIKQHDLISGISMAIESGDETVRKLLLDRHEKNKTIKNAIKNMKSFGIPLRTQAIVGLPVMKPKIAVNQSQTNLSLVDKNGVEHYYDDPLQESIKCLELVCSSDFSLDDYYWNAVYSPFPGTPLGDYTIAAGFSSSKTVDEAFLFSSESKLRCFDSLTAKRQIAFTFTSNYFSHLKNGPDMMSLYIYRNIDFTISSFADFIFDKHHYFINKSQATVRKKQLIDFLEYAYSTASCSAFKELNIKLIYYYLNLMDGIILAAKVASYYFSSAHNDTNDFTLYDLYKIERSHYYDNSYLMPYIPIKYFEFFSDNYKGSLSKYEFR